MYQFRGYKYYGSMGKRNLDHELELCSLEFFLDFETAVNYGRKWIKCYYDNNNEQEKRKNCDLPTTIYWYSAYYYPNDYVFGEPAHGYFGFIIEL